MNTIPVNPKLEELSKKARELTMSPGVYLMKNSSGEIIYIGKAKALKNRVSQYFQPNNPSHNEKVKKMVSQVDNFDYIVVDSEFEALVLECSLIKQNMPKYNILLKDDKGYHYIKITKEDYPRISAQKQLEDDKNADYLGPFASSFSVNQTVDEVNRIFMLPTCSKKFPQDIKKSRPCLNFHIKQCMGVCRGRTSKAEYNDSVNQAIAYIKKGEGNLSQRLTDMMNEAAEALDFERAAKLRDRIAAIKRITDRQKVVMVSAQSQDVIALAFIEPTAVASILKFRNSRLVDKEDYVLSDTYDLSQARQEFLNQYYLSADDVPKKIIVDATFEEQTLLEDFLTERQKSRVYISVPQKGESKQILDMAYKNASERLSKFLSRTAKEVSALEELTTILGLSKAPEYIEAYDISNLGESDIVAGMVVFQNGRPLKKAYKKFKIKEVIGQDDYSSMSEVIRRRFNHYFEEKETGEGFGRLPDLILLDGGKGHVSTILPIIRGMGLDIPVFGMVKDSKHRTRAIAADGAEISISTFKSAFAFVTNIQDEVHRFSINYQKTAHKKTTLSLTITRVEGIGDKKATTLLKAYKTKEALKNATPEELAKTAKVNIKVATELYDFIQNAM